MCTLIDVLGYYHRVSNPEYDMSTILEQNLHESQEKYAFLAEK